jgi:hypothetical protein
MVKINKKAQLEYLSSPWVLLAVGIIVIFIGLQVYNSGYDKGFNEANQSYTKCLKNMDLSQRHYQELLSQKDLEIENLITQSENWRDAYFDCINKPKQKIIFPHFTFNLIIYNILIIGISILLFFNLFRGTIRMSFGKKIDEIIKKNKILVVLFKLGIWCLMMVYILIGIFER